MSTQNLMTALHDYDFADLLKRSEPKRCMFDLEGQCNNSPVDGHFIQEGLLKLIQDSKKQVVSFYNVKATDWAELDVEYALNRPTSPDEAAKCQFLCDDHEKFFWLVENPSPNWDDPEHRAILVYRACLINRYIKEWFINFSSNIPFLSEVVVSQQEQLTGAIPLESATRKHLNGVDTGQLRHTVVRVQGRPIIAASGVILHPPLGTFFYDTWDDRVIPTRSSPVVITVLPTREDQVAMFSYTLDGIMNAKHLLDALEYHNGSIGTARFSKKLLEEVEFIHISPEAWASLGRPKQEFITHYWEASFDTSESEINISPSHVNLFATPS